MIETTSKEILSFDAEVGKVLQLMINSLYTNKDIFLRELISNASDACDKCRYEAIAHPEFLEGKEQFKITITADKEKRTLSITDNGIGMNREDLIAHLGTIARSGTEAFLTQMDANSKKNLQLIGQFGVGFYSSFMVADTVEVVSTKAGEKQSYKWVSDGKGSYSIETLDETKSRGTTITLYLRDGQDLFTDKHHIKHVVTTYSDHIGFPVYFNDPTLNNEVLLNHASALWAKPKAEITAEQYQQFYQHVAHQHDEPWAVLHNKSEGIIEYTNLLFIPSVKPFDLFHPERKSSVKLYVKRVFITDEHAGVLPSYLRFIKGVVDSEDLPLNISRETLQHNTVIEKIRSSLVKRILSELKKRASEDAVSFATFYSNFGAVLKEGLCESLDNKETILEICRFTSDTSEGNLMSLDDYIARMPEKQQYIYYLSGDSVQSLALSPQLEGFKKRGIEVIFLTDTVDDFWVNVVHEYKGKEFRSVTKASDELLELPLNFTESEGDNIEAEHVLPEKELTDVKDRMKEVLKNVISDIRVSHKLTDSPVCLAVKEGAMDLRMERFLVDQKQLPGLSAKILEINTAHPIIRQLANDCSKVEKAEEVQELIEVLYDQACIAEGQQITNPALFTRRLSKFLTRALTA